MKVIKMLKNKCFSQRSILIILTLVISTFPEVTLYAAGAGISFISDEKDGYPPGEEVILKVLRGDSLPQAGTITVELISANGGEFSGANLSGICTTSFSPGPVNANIIGNNLQKAFCYRNSNTGLDTITAKFTKGTSTEEIVTLDLEILSDELDTEPPICVSNDGCDGTSNPPSTGVLVVNKLLNSNDALILSDLTDFSQFSFTINGVATTSFDSTGHSFVNLPVGRYNIVEVPVIDYETTSYDNCENITITARATTTCTIVNTRIVIPPPGPKPETYKIEGYVWHDDNGNTIWDKNDENQERVSEEAPLANWTVNITDGSSTRSMLTDEFGHYIFWVDAGTWIITEDVKEGWQRTTVESYTVTFPEPEIITAAPWSTWNFLIPVAQAAAVSTSDIDYNFGNDEVEPVIVPATPPKSSHSSSGSRKKLLTTISAPTPTPQVLGEQIIVIPVGAPEAGAGGMSPGSPTLVIGQLLYLRQRRDWRGLVSF